MNLLVEVIRVVKRLATRAARAERDVAVANCPLDKHLVRVSQQIRQAIPREDFSGIAVIDFEEWRPLYQLNWGKKSVSMLVYLRENVYKRESLRLVKEQYPFISDKSAEELAKKEFNNAAKKIFLHTIAIARQLRPYARWGFYGFPYCNYDAGNSETDMLCSESFRRFNDQMSFIYQASTALFPSIYLSLKGTSAQNYRYIQKDVCNSLKQAADMGARGVILWSSSKNMKQRCDGLANYVRDMLGPCVAYVTYHIISV
ncbi:unnamed protein product [Nippostrongylus brasiliensis]|uniref:Hyaluronidase n=1 Tax=Nippostrongylus brasiliensis TaxID=27835 RepID=A0A0N4YF70_NIPBR|nr:unnamed protein product [Nippostrongylus brasiliensis]